MSVSSRPNQSKLSMEDANEIRRRYDEQINTRDQLAEMFGVSRTAIFQIVHEITYRTVPAMRVEGPALPSRAQTLPVIHMRDMAGTWWPSVPRQCRTCGGRMFLRPIDNVDGGVYCSSCARESHEVRP